MKGPEDDEGLAGKVALISGGGAAGEGIGNGRAAAILLARAGAKVMVADRELALAQRTVEIVLFAIVTSNVWMMSGPQPPLIIGELADTMLPRKVQPLTLPMCGSLSTMHIWWKSKQVLYSNTRSCATSPLTVNVWRQSTCATRISDAVLP